MNLATTANASDDGEESEDTEGEDTEGVDPTGG
jgi:hypothetical protein